MASDGTEAEGARKRPRRSPDAILKLILDSASAAFQRDGYDATTTAAIARAAEVTETQLFRYFRSKAELFRQAILEPLNARFERFNATRLHAAPASGDWRADARIYIAELMQFIEQHRDMLMPLIVAQRYARSSVDGVGAVGALQSYFDLGARSMRLNIPAGTPANPQAIVRISFASVLATVLFRDWLLPPEVGTPDEIADALIDYVLAGIGPYHARDGHP